MSIFVLVGILGEEFDPRNVKGIILGKAAPSLEAAKQKALPYLDARITMDFEWQTYQSAFETITYCLCDFGSNHIEGVAIVEIGVE